MAEMTALVAAVYRRYETKLAPGFDDISPAITSRFELFYDETTPSIAVRYSDSLLVSDKADLQPRSKNA